MGRYIARRVLWMIPVLFIISIMTFALTKMVPGGPFNAEKRLPAEIIADAGDNQVVSGGATVTLDGSASRSTLGRPLTFQWAQTGGPTVSLNGPQTARPAFTAPLLAARTDFVFRLTVSDGTTSEQDWTTVTVDADDPGVGLRDGELLVTPVDAFSSTGPTVCRFSTMATRAPPEKMSGRSQPTVTMALLPSASSSLTG